MSINYKEITAVCNSILNNDSNDINDEDTYNLKRKKIMKQMYKDCWYVRGGPWRETYDMVYTIFDQIKKLLNLSLKYNKSDDSIMFRDWYDYIDKYRNDDSYDCSGVGRLADDCRDDGRYLRYAPFYMHNDSGEEWDEDHDYGFQ